jgi:hypothetical protein
LIDMRRCMTIREQGQAMGTVTSGERDDLDRWVERGLITDEQRAAIVAFERNRTGALQEAPPGRLASAISTFGAAVAIAAVAGIVGLFIEDWSSAQALVAAITGSLVTLAAAWLLVRNGWGAPAGLLAFCGLALLPVAFGLAADVAGWWPEDDPRRDWEEIDRERRRVIGITLLLSIVPGMLTLRLGLRQAWAALPAAVWFGVTLLFTDPFENTTLVIAQVAFGAVVAGLAVFVWWPHERGRGAAWWLQLGGLVLAAQGIAFSAVEERALFWLAGALAAAAIFAIGVSRGRTAWMVAGAVPAIVPIGRLIFEYFEGIGGLFIVAVAGLAIAFLPLLLLRRRRRSLLSGG